jgi:hypothetical protein
MLQSFLPVPLAGIGFRALFIVALMPAGVWASDASIQQRFRSDMAQCRHDTAALKVKNCEREAYVARREALRGALTDTPDQYQANALRRCEAFSGFDRLDCEARMGAGARLSGGVEEGGILREATTPDTGTP